VEQSRFNREITQWGHTPDKTVLSSCSGKGGSCSSGTKHDRTAHRLTLFRTADREAEGTTLKMMPWLRIPVRVNPVAQTLSTIDEWHPDQLLHETKPKTPSWPPRTYNIIITCSFICMKNRRNQILIHCFLHRRFTLFMTLHASLWFYPSFNIFKCSVYTMNKYKTENNIQLSQHAHTALQQNVFSTAIRYIWFSP
jgi:hypothetical protein